MKVSGCLKIIRIIGRNGRRIFFFLIYRGRKRTNSGFQPDGLKVPELVSAPATKMPAVPHYFLRQLFASQARLNPAKAETQCGPIRNN